MGEVVQNKVSEFPTFHCWLFSFINTELALIKHCCLERREMPRG